MRSDAFVNTRVVPRLRQETRERASGPGRFALVPLLVMGLFLAVFAARSLAQAPEELKVQGYVSDLAGVLSSSGREQLTELCSEVDQKAQAQIAVVTVKSLGGRTIEDYSIGLATRLGIGPKSTNRGVLVLLAVEDRRYRIEVGYGLEAILPDGKVGGFGREAVPYLRQNDYDSAMLLMTRRVADVIGKRSDGRASDCVCLGRVLSLQRPQHLVIFNPFAHGLITDGAEHRFAGTVGIHDERVP